MVRDRATHLREEIVPFPECLQVLIEIPDTYIGSGLEPAGIFIEGDGVFRIHGLIRTKCRQDTYPDVRLPDLAVKRKRVHRVVRGADGLYLHPEQQPADGIFRGAELFIAAGVDPCGAKGAEQFLYPEIALQLQVRPVIEWIA